MGAKRPIRWELTDDLLAPAYAGLTEAQAIALVNGVAMMAHALDL